MVGTSDLQKMSAIEDDLALGKGGTLSKRIRSERPFTSEKDGKKIPREADVLRWVSGPVRISAVISKRRNQPSKIHLENPQVKEF